MRLYVSTSSTIIDDAASTWIYFINRKTGSVIRMQKLHRSGAHHTPYAYWWGMPVLDYL